ncbi:MAG: type II and III secretion system protein [Deltaproteobacteria bacterium]|nr:type II and III secretion system protein [Deltaproteobacteria bacterium]
MPHTIKSDNNTTKILLTALWLLSLGAMLFLWGCVAATPTPEDQAAKFIANQTKGAVNDRVVQKKTIAAQLPVRFQNPSYLISDTGDIKSGLIRKMTIPVGAKITTTSPKPLRVVIQELAKLKSMNVSWASDVDKNALVNVTIMPEEDFFEAIDNLLRQVDYFYELHGDTIIIKHKETKRFHIAMPFMSMNYSVGIGGDVLGSTEGSNMSGTLNMASNKNKFDIWKNIKKNLDKILEIWSAPVPVSTPAASAAISSTKAQAAKVVPSAAVYTPPPDAGKGYYTIDQPIGLITVTAPRSLLIKVSSYLNNLKAELYKQITIEAKIVEVTLTNDDTTGINWDDLLSNSFGLKLDFQKMSSSSTHAQFLTLENKNFSLVLDAIKQQGHVEVLSSPKISVMNGQPAMLSVGQNVKYVDSVSSTTDGTTGSITYTVNTASVMSGLGLGVVATIGDNNEIILSLTPVTSKLTLPIEYKVFGANQVGLPKVNLREMNTLVRVKDGEMLIVGGLIDNSSSYADSHVSGLGRIPLIGKLFRNNGTSSVKKELIILLRPHIVPL